MGFCFFRGKIPAGNSSFRAGNRGVDDDDRHRSFGRDRSVFECCAARIRLRCRCRPAPVVRKAVGAVAELVPIGQQPNDRDPRCAVVSSCSKDELMASGSGSGAARLTRRCFRRAPIAGAANCSMAPANRSTESMSRPTGCHDRRWEAEIAACRNLSATRALASGGVNIKGELLGERTIAPPPSFRFRAAFSRRHCSKSCSSSSTWSFSSSIVFSCWKFSRSSSV